MEMHGLCWLHSFQGRIDYEYTLLWLIFILHPPRIDISMSNSAWTHLSWLWEIWRWPIHSPPKLRRCTSCHQQGMPRIPHWEKSSRDPSGESLHTPCSEGASRADHLSWNGSKLICPSPSQQPSRPGQPQSGPQRWERQIAGSDQYSSPGYCFLKAEIEWLWAEIEDFRADHGGWCPPWHLFCWCPKHHIHGKFPQHHPCGRGPQTPCL